MKIAATICRRHPPSIASNYTPLPPHIKRFHCKEFLTNDRAASHYSRPLNPTDGPCTFSVMTRSSPQIVAGIDVGGKKKGFHAVALRDGAYLGQLTSCDPKVIADWCRKIGARLIGIDAPCRWSTTGRARPAEQELMAEGIWCFATPSRKAADARTDGYYAWMMNGAKLFRHLETSHPLFDGDSRKRSATACFETFPQAIACALAGKIVPAKKKRVDRRNILKLAGIEIAALSNIDTVDAALCALTAHYFALGRVKMYGEAKTGLIVAPNFAIKGLTSPAPFVAMRRWFMTNFTPPPL
jgi:predicted nuclease with RNAse H fold